MDTCLRLKDPDPDLALFFRDRQDANANANKILCILLFKVRFIFFSKIKSRKKKQYLQKKIFLFFA